MLKKWLILAIVLSCAIFAVSSGCSEKGKESTNQSVVENTNPGAVENTKENTTAADKDTGAAATPSKDSGKETSMNIESTDSSGEKTKTTIVSTGNSDDWCAVGSSWSTINPQTGETANMKITGTESIDGVTMCKAVYETNDKSSEVSKLEYFWSEDGKNWLWITYDASGKVVSKTSMKNDKMTMVDKDGKVTEITTTQS